MPRPVIDAIAAHLDLESSIGGYEAEAEAASSIAECYSLVGSLLGAPPENIAFTEHATASFVAALSSIRFEPGDVLLTTACDYASNQIQYLSLADRFGIQIERIPDLPEGGVDLDAMKAAIHRRRPRLVAVTHIPTNSGLVQDVAAIGRMCRERGVLFLVDGCQSVGQMPVDVREIGCDFFSATSRKYLRGPRGAGFLYVSDRVLSDGLEPLFPDLRGADWIDDDLYQPAPDAKRFETWEFFWGLVLGTGAAARYAMDLGLEAIQERSWSLADTLRDRLNALDGVESLDRGTTLCATVTCSVEGWAPSDLVRELRKRQINTTGQSKADAVIDYDRKGVEGALRISPHYFNTEGELDQFLSALDEVRHG